MSGDERRVGELVGGKYRVVRLLARGGMGVVYEAQHTLVKRRFAVKFLRPELAERRESLIRFQREAQTAGALESENVTAAVDFGIAEDRSPYIVMEYLVGESLEALLRREGRLPVARAADLVHQACRGIQAAHASGIVHRDLKPQNLFVCRREDGTDLLKVLDFGIAKLEVVDKSNTQTRTGAVLGTPAYMSPEQARGEKGIDQRGDVYALGAILYELLSERKPHPGTSYNAILHHIATQPPVPLEPERYGLPPELVKLVERALSRDAAERFASADALGQALSTWAKREVWPPAPSEEASAPRPASESPLRRSLHGAGGRRRLWLMAGAAGFAVAFALVWVQARSGGDDRVAAPEASSAVATVVDSSPAPALATSNAEARSVPALATAPAEPAVAVSSSSGRSPEEAERGRAAPSKPPLRHAGGAARTRDAERPGRVGVAHGTEPSPAPVPTAPAAPAASGSVPVAFDQHNPYE